jgi:hypothetical protein
MLNITQIPASRIALTDPTDGTITTQWFRFFVNMYTLQNETLGVVAVANGGTGQTSYTNGQLLIGNSTGNTLVKNTLTAGSNITITNGPGTIQLDVILPTNIVNTFSAGTTGFTPVTPAAGNIVLAGTLNIANGGTGQTSYTNGQLLIGNSAGNTLTKTTLTAGTAIGITNGAGAITVTNTGVTAFNTRTGAITLTSSDVTTALGYTPGTVTSVNASGGTTGLTFSGGPVTSSGTLTLSGNLISDYVSYTAPYTSSVARTGTSKWSDIVSVKDFGATGNGSTDDTVAIQNAINTNKHVYFPTGTYRITDSLNIGTQGQMFTGDGQRRSVIYVNGSFNMSATGVIVFGDGDIELHNLWIRFYQPDTNNRNSLISYPVAIYAYNRAGFKINSCSITNATNGINMTGNCGQAQIEDLAMSAYYTGISIDGSLDTIRVNKYHFWNFEMTGNQASIFYTSPTRGFDVGRVDGLFIQQYLNISNLGMNMYQGASGSPWVYVTDSGFDTFNGIYQEAGSLQVVNSYITNAASGGYSAIYVNANNQFTQFTNCEFFAGPSNGGSMINFNGTDASLTLTNCYFNNYCNAQPMIYVTGTRAFFSMSDCTFNFGGANGFCVWSEGAQEERVHLVNNYINTQANTAYSGPMFQFQPGCRVYMTGNRVNDKGANAATFIQNNADNYSWISGNISPGWTNNFIGSGTGYYANNLT